MQAIVNNCQVFKTGTGKTGKPYTLYKVITQDGQEATGFLQVQPGQTVELTTTQNGQYTNTNYALPEGQQPAQQQAQPPVQQQNLPGPAGQQQAQQQAPMGGDKRVLQMLVIIAEQLGADHEKIMGILES